MKILTEEQERGFYYALADDRIPDCSGGETSAYRVISYRFGRLYSVSYSAAFDKKHHNDDVSIWVANSYFSVDEKEDNVLFNRYKAMWTAADNRFYGKDYIDPFGYKDAVLEKSFDNKVRG
jgi:hypothetical protein